MAKIRVLVVDDAVVVRRIVTDVLSSDPDIEVVGTAANGRLALQKLAGLKPDLVTLDIEMPEMDGLTALPQMLKRDPTLKVIMASTLTRRNAEVSLRALDLGAADYMAKPTSTTELNSAQDFKRELGERVKALHSLVPILRASRRGGRERELFFELSRKVLGSQTEVEQMLGNS